MNISVEIGREKRIRSKIYDLGMDAALLMRKMVASAGQRKRADTEKQQPGNGGRRKMKTVGDRKTQVKKAGLVLVLIMSGLFWPNNSFRRMP